MENCIKYSSKLQQKVFLHNAVFSLNHATLLQVLINDFALNLKIDVKLYSVQLCDIAIIINTFNYHESQFNVLIKIPISRQQKKIHIFQLLSYPAALTQITKYYTVAICLIFHRNLSANWSLIGCSWQKLWEINYDTSIRVIKRESI